MSKFKNKKVIFDGMTFDSKKECERYKVLKAWQEMGVISDLRTQVAFELARGIKIAGESRKRPSVRYVADFVYLIDRQAVRWWKMSKVPLHERIKSIA